MTRVTTSNYGADATTQFAWATTDQDLFDREDDLYNLAQAVEHHTHGSGRGLAVTRVAANTIDTNAIQALAVTEAKLAGLSVTNAKLAAGAALANLGYTPVNKAGDSNIGALAIAAAVTLNNAFAFQGKESGGTIRWLLGLWSDNIIYLGTDTNALTIDGSSLTVSITGATILGGTSVTINCKTQVSRAGASLTDWSNHQIVVTGTSDSLAAISFERAGASVATLYQEGGVLKTRQNDGTTGTLLHSGSAGQVPSGATVWFRTSAELSSAGSGWTEETSLRGRIPYGAGTTHGQTFTANNDVGSNWTPVTGLSSSATGGPLETFPVAGGGTQVGSGAHTHNAGSINGQGSVWIPPGRVGVFGRKT